MNAKLHRNLNRAFRAADHRMVARKGLVVVASVHVVCGTRAIAEVITPSWMPGGLPVEGIA